jgi:hypothetical protein
MSLISFHRLLISLAILFCGGYALWELRAFLGHGEIGSLLIAIIFAAAAVGLAYYLRHLSRFLRLPGERGASPPPSG